MLDNCTENSNNFVEPQESRYERKFLIDDLSLHEVINIIKMHPAMFNDIYQQRYINNIYYDTPDFTNYLDNIEGNSVRTKYRIRWYEKFFGKLIRAVFEIKSKNGYVGKKNVFKINDFKLKENVNTSQLKNLLKDPQLPEHLKNLPIIPTLINRYSRKYFQSFDHQFRITLDSDFSFLGVTKKKLNLLHGIKDNHMVILELKYDSNFDTSANKITKHFPFRMTKSSKYVIGVEKCFKI